MLLRTIRQLNGASSAGGLPLVRCAQVPRATSSQSLRSFWNGDWVASDLRLPETTGQHITDISAVLPIGLADGTSPYSERYEQESPPTRSLRPPSHRQVLFIRQASGVAPSGLTRLYARLLCRRGGHAKVSCDLCQTPRLLAGVRLLAGRGRRPMREAGGTAKYRTSVRGIGAVAHPRPSTVKPRALVPRRTHGRGPCAPLARAQQVTQR